VIALLSGADGSIGQIPQNHFYALEVLRNVLNSASALPKRVPFKTSPYNRCF
jgi:hypothetical protein